MGYIPFHGELSMSTADDTDNLSTNLVFLETTLSQHLSICLSIFASWGHMRTLCPPAGHPGRNALISSRYATRSLVTLENGLIRCLGRGSSPLVPESVKICGPKNVHDHGDNISYFVT